MSSEPEDVESKQTAEPWKEQKPYIIQGLGDAADIYAGGAPGFFPGSTVAPLNGAQIGSLNNIVTASGSPNLTQSLPGFRNFANGQNAGSPYLNAAGSTYGNVAGGGGAGAPELNAASATYGKVAGGEGLGMGQMYGAAAGYGNMGSGQGPGWQGMNQALSGYGQVANTGGIGGAGGLDTLQQAAAGDLIGKNPYLDAIYNRGAGDIQSRLSGAASAAGRYGSGAMGHQLTQDLGDFNNQLYGSQYAQERAHQLGASQFLQGQAMNALGGQAAVGGQQAGTALNALGGQLAAGQAIGGQQLAGAAGQAGVGAQQTGLQLQGAAGQAGVGQQQAANQQYGLNSLANADAARIANLQAGVQAGNAFQNQKQQNINAEIQRWNYEQNAPMNWVQQYLGTVGGGYGGGTTTTQTPYFQPSPWQQALGIGTGLAGIGSMF